MPATSAVVSVLVRLPIDSTADRFDGFRAGHATWYPAVPALSLSRQRPGPLRRDCADAMVA